MSKVRRKSTHHISSLPVKDVHNPFSDFCQTNYRECQSKKSPKHSKRAGKCFQLVLICQKLLKPFSSSSKVTQPDVTKQLIKDKEISKSTQEVNGPNRIPVQTAIFKPCKVDACVQTNRDSFPDISQCIIEDGYDTNQGSEDFPYDVDESLKESYWDLDIDSAIVGDFNSMSAFSLDEQIDPHYATIKVTADGKVIDKPQFMADPNFFASVYPNEKISYPNSCTSSPKSGIYSKIMKPRKPNESNFPISNYYRLNTGSKINFEKALSIRSQLGNNYLSTESNVYPADTPDIPLRNYGSSVINYVTKLQQYDAISHSCISSSVVYRDQKLSSTNLYSPIWLTDRSPANKICELPLTPASEPVATKRSLNKILHQLNPTYLDDSSEDTSSISFYSPAKAMKYSYPRNFSDNNSTKYSYAVDEIFRFRHMDSERRLLRAL